MSWANTRRDIRGSIRSETRRAAARAANWLHLVAAPTFALMALLGAVVDGDAHRTTCLGVAEASPLSSMSFMYLLMSAFHATPWLKLASGRRTLSGASGPRSRKTLRIIPSARLTRA